MFFDKQIVAMTKKEDKYMKKTILLSIIVFIVTINLIACNIVSKNEISNIWDDESSEKKNLEIVKQMVDEPVSDVFDLYFVTSSFPMVETLKEFEEGEQQINLVISKLKDKNGIHAFSKEAEELIEQMTLSAKQVIYYKKLHLEYLELKNTEKSENVQQSYFDEITNIADKMKEYEKLYNNFKSSKH